MGGEGERGSNKVGPHPHQIHMSMYLMRECGGGRGWVGEVLNRGRCLKNISSKDVCLTSTGSWLRRGMLNEIKRRRNT